ncbi:high mobility group B protein 9-like isoform X2 [Chenopodium quinoa]|uniref:high mobility group B protein 9-like isoform X2 n=1 Tax=Chenopodium quinoa TaxID=63459 RepID=UPI000B76EF62|nr:high mobility group B protein 9-like isoform X2 [Chenopodium quinoa]
MIQASEKENYNYPSPLATHEEVISQPQLFFDTLKSLHSMLGTKFTVPVIGRRELDLHVLYVEVTKRGGYIKVVSEKKWREISSVFKFSVTATSASSVLKKHYLGLLYQYEQLYFFNVQSPVSSTPPDSSPLSIPAVGTIHGKFDCGYLVSVRLGQELLSGVIYHPVDKQCPSSSPADDLSMAIIPYDPNKQPRQVPGKRRRKRKRWGGDPSHPKPNRSGYNFYFSEKHSVLKSLYPNSREREFTKMIGESWNNLNSEERKVYQNIGERDKERYKRELQEYNAKLAAMKGMCSYASIWKLTIGMLPQVVLE